MKKRIAAFFLIIFLCFTVSAAAYAQEESNIDSGNGLRLADMADLLQESEEKVLLALLDEMSERQQLDIVVVTANTLNGKTPMKYADDFYDYNDYGFGAQKDGVLLLVSMEDRDWWISTTGYGITAFTDAGITYIGEQFLPALGDGDYADAFTTFAQLCDKFITQAKTGEPYDKGSFPKEPFSFGANACIALVVGGFFAVITTTAMKGSLKSVRFHPTAADYVRSGSMQVTDAKELFLYTHIDRIKRQKESSSQGGGSTTHTSSSGMNHGGGGGKF